MARDSLLPAEATAGGGSGGDVEVAPDPELDRQRRFLLEQQTRRHPRWISPEQLPPPRPTPGRDVRVTLTPTRREWQQGWVQHSPIRNERIQMPACVEPGWHNLGPYGGHGRWGGPRGTLWVEVQLPPTAFERARRWLATELADLVRFLGRAILMLTKVLLLALIGLLVVVGGAGAVFGLWPV